MSARHVGVTRGARATVRGRRAAGVLCHAGARYIRALVTAAQLPEVVALADHLVTARSATVDWLTTGLAEDALGRPRRCAAPRCRRRPGPR
ncbi:hypothetical protein IU427_19405 [Nocardia beijingensis]|nr:hypothetical protein [Nocardia beijingensis]